MIYFDETTTYTYMYNFFKVFKQIKDTWLFLRDFRVQTGKFGDHTIESKLLVLHARPVLPITIAQ